MAGLPAVWYTVPHDEPMGQAVMVAKRNNFAVLVLALLEWEGHTALGCCVPG